MGRVGDVLFHPDEPRVIGFTVERPDVAMMVERRDRMLALDRTTFADGRIEVNGKAAWDGSAGKRLGVDWDKSVVWTGMPVHTSSGTQLGLVRDAVFDPATGALNALGLTSGMAADIAVGVRDLPARLVVGFDGAGVIVADEAASIDVNGGAAAVAGRTTAVARDAAKRTAANASVQAAKAAVVASDGIDKAARAAGATAAKAAVLTRTAASAAAKSDTGKKALGWLKKVRHEVVDAMAAPDDDEDDTP